MALRNRHLAALFVYLTFTFSGSLLGQVTTLAKRFTVASHGGVPMGLMIETAPGKIEPIEFRAGERSREYSTSAPLAFFTVSRPTTANTAPVRTRVAQATIPDGTKRALLLFVPNMRADPSTSTDRYRVLVFEDSLDSFPAATVRFFNASGLQLAGLANKAQVSFGPGLSAPFSARTGLRVQLAMRHRDQFIPSFDQEITVELTQRLICILLPPDSPKSPLVSWSFISDYIAPPVGTPAR